MSGTAYKCGQCNGQGVLLINISSDGEGNSFVEKPCPLCEGRKMITKAELMTCSADATFEPSEMIAIPMTGAMRVYVDGEVFQRKMSSRQLYKLAHYALGVAMETEAYEKENK
jgi:DnaJ-class molecular chaperone